MNNADIPAALMGLRPGTSVGLNRDGSVEVRYPDGSGRMYAPFSDEARLYRSHAGGDAVLGAPSRVPKVERPDQRTVTGIDRVNRVVTFE